MVKDAKAIYTKTNKNRQEVTHSLTETLMRQHLGDFWESSHSLYTTTHTRTHTHTRRQYALSLESLISISKTVPVCTLKLIVPFLTVDYANRAFTETVAK